MERDSGRRRYVDLLLLVGVAQDVVDAAEVELQRELVRPSGRRTRTQDAGGSACASTRDFWEGEGRSGSAVEVAYPGHPLQREVEVGATLRERVVHAAPRHTPNSGLGVPERLGI